MEDRTPQKNSDKALWPILISLLFLGAALYLGYLLWQKGMAMTEARAEQVERIDALKAERDRLQHMLSISPCEAKSAISPRSAAPTAQATPAVAANSAKSNKPASAKSAVSAADVEKACVFIVCLVPPRQISTGSGFFVAPGYVVTNKHVVGNSKGKILVTSQSLGAPAFGKVVAISPESNRDYALLKVDMPTGANVATLNFAPEIKRTQKVGAWGFPNLVGKNDPQYARLLRGEDFSAVPELSYTEGVVSAVLNRNPPLIVHTAPISPGNSGGPLVNENGEVVGINTMISLDEDSYRQASIALEAADLKKFLSANGLRLSQ